MKKNYAFILALFLLSSWSAVVAQSTTCLDMTQVGNLPGDLNDDSTYPAGFILASTTQMDLIKTYNSKNWSSGERTDVHWLDGNSIFYAGWLTLDVSKTSCTNKILAIEVTSDMIIIDGDTLLGMDLQTADYDGVNYDVTYMSNVYTITGDFNEVIMGDISSMFTGACLSTSNCLATGSQEEHSIASALVYPNPTDGDVFIDLGHSDGLVQIYNAVGTLVYTSRSSASGLLTVSDLGASGMYFVQVTLQGKTQVTKVVKK